MTYKLSDLSSILYSYFYAVQDTAVYDDETRTCLVKSRPIEYVIKQFGDREVKHISAENDKLIIDI